jgi:alcohol dehydrogenase (NADP+)
MKAHIFKNKDSMPALGLGTWKSAPGDVYKAVKIAIKTGYRHIDCAPVYGNEKEVGKAISECIAEGMVKRTDLWITSKLWNNQHARTDVVSALKQTLSDLNTTYLDLFLIHWPIALKKNIMFPQSGKDMISLKEIPLTETWKGMEEAIDAGLARHIGVSNFGINNLTTILNSARIRPEVNQVECHPYLQQEELFAFCNTNSVFLTAYSPLGSPDRPDGIKAKNEPLLLQDKIINEIAKARKASTAQILISWALQRGTSVIPKSVHAGRIAENLKAEEIRLSESEMEQISKLDKSYRYVSGSFWVFEGGPYTLEDVWR